jgi:hypothetical protein
MCIVNQPSKEQVRAWLRQRQVARSLPEMEQIRAELGWIWSASSGHPQHARSDAGVIDPPVNGVANSSL